jgi:hypothetical protein
MSMSSQLCSCHDFLPLSRPHGAGWIWCSAHASWGSHLETDCKLVPVKPDIKIRTLKLKPVRIISSFLKLRIVILHHGYLTKLLITPGHHQLHQPSRKVMKRTLHKFLWHQYMKITLIDDNEEPIDYVYNIAVSLDYTDNPAIMMAPILPYSGFNCGLRSSGHGRHWCYTQLHEASSCISTYRLNLVWECLYLNQPNGVPIG